MPHFIQGKWYSKKTTPFSSQNPATGDTLWEGFEACEQTVDKAVKAASKAFPLWVGLPFKKRFSYLQQFASTIAKNKKNLAETLSKETGKPLWESLLELESMQSKIPLSLQAYQERCPTKEKPLKQATLVTHHKPQGVIAILGPFNLPAHLPNGHIIPALLAGNTVVFKSSALTPLVAEEIFKCWEKVGLPDGVLNLIQGNAATGSFLANHPKIDGLFFTGTLKTGRKLLKTFASYPEKILALEMGGNNPLIISDTNSLQAAASLAIQSAFITSGQRCSCARRLIVIKNKRQKEFLDILCKKIHLLRIGSYQEQPEPFMGPVISLPHKQHLLKKQKWLQKEGGKSLIEMRSLQHAFLSPGLIDITSLSSYPDEEIFGPLLQLIYVPHFAAALQVANDTRYGLCAGLISSSSQEFTQFYRGVKAGIINWNAPLTGASSHAPFGGVKQSGNHRPSAFYAADYCSYPVATIKNTSLQSPKIYPGMS